jgi:hypothetical protein
MNKLLSLPKTIVNLIDHPVLSSNLRTSTWVLVGGLVFQLLSTLLTPRIAIFFCIGALLFRLVPTVLITRGNIPNPEIAGVNLSRSTVMFPKEDGSGDLNPAGKGVTLLILGIKISHPLGFLAPGAKDAGDFFTSLVDELNNNRTKYGWLAGSIVRGVPTNGASENGHLSIVGYFKSVKDLHDFAHGDMHRDAWNWWNKNASNLPHIGLYHEAYDVPKHSWEAVYLQCAPLGLAQAKVEGEGNDGKRELMDLIVDANKGPWRSSSGRMGRKEGPVILDDSYIGL